MTYFDQQITKWGDDTYSDLFDKQFNVFSEYVIHQSEFIPKIDTDDLKMYFIIFLINNKTESEYNEYLSLKYSDDIVDLFLDLKDISSSYCCNVLHEKNRTANDLLEFINQFFDVEENIIDEEYNQSNLSDYDE